MTDNVLEPRDGPPLPPNGEVEGPDDHARSAPRAHTACRRPRRRTTHASRPPPTIVRHRVRPRRILRSLRRPEYRVSYKHRVPNRVRQDTHNGTVSRCNKSALRPARLY